MRRHLHRAFDDFTNGVEALFGLGRSSPDLVTELLGGCPECGRTANDPADRTRRQAPPRRPRVSRRAARAHLSRVK